jgi:hypothetical protein
LKYQVDIFQNPMLFIMSKNILHLCDIIEWHVKYIYSQKLMSVFHHNNNTNISPPLLAFFF